ncbi:hypothetical protein [Nocardia amamiensis]|uniref:hypothetical protein n=1 Tax=Nocardia amamiensis TaxID=404578 RepID=UPI0033FFAC8F
MSVRMLLILVLAETAGIGAALAAGFQTWAMQPSPNGAPAILAIIGSGVIAKLLVTFAFASFLDRLVD